MRIKDFLLKKIKYKTPRERQFLEDLEKSKEAERQFLDAFYEEYEQIKSLKIIEIRPFYDKKWEIKLNNEDRIVIVRDEMDDIYKLVESIKQLPTISKESLLTLDERHTIYYD